MKSLRVLVVEDYPDIAEIWCKWIGLAGHQAEVCWTGSQALEIAAAFRPDLVILDIGLPDIDGWEVAVAMRKEPLLAGTKILAISAYQSDEDKLRSQASGIDAHIGKPACKEDFVKALVQMAE
ncbi:MAG TPA: response regulator [Pirellulales bacterium]|nr:response regulator [Pirellulales bacterium]